MNIQEFKYWLEGFEAAIDGAPNEAQWRIIKDKLAQVCDTYVYMPPVIVPIYKEPCYPNPYTPIYNPTYYTYPNTIVCDSSSTEVNN